MSLYVSVGQKITASHNNQIVDAICNLENKNNSSFDGIDYIGYDSESNPAFNLLADVAGAGICGDGEKYAIYFNSQDKLKQLVNYNGEWIDFCTIVCLESTNVTVDYCNKIYQFGRYVDTSTGVGLTQIDLTIFKPKTEDSCTTTQTDSPETSEGETTDIYYTLAPREDIVALGYDIIKSYPLGLFKDFGINQIHEGIIVDGSSAKPKVDTEIDTAETASISYEIDNDSGNDVEYLALYNFKGSFSDNIDERDFETVQSTEYKVVFSKCGQCSERLELAYGNAKDYFILNDICAVEPDDYVLPRSLSSVQNIVVGLGLDTDNKDICGNNIKEVATICFTNPYIESGCTDGCSQTGVLSGDLIFTLCDDKHSGIFKEYKPVTICQTLCNDYLTVHFDCATNEYQIYGPEIKLTLTNPECTEAIWCGCNGQMGCAGINWDLYIPEPIYCLNNIHCTQFYLEGCTFGNSGYNKINIETHNNCILFGVKKFIGAYANCTLVRVVEPFSDGEALEFISKDVHCGIDSPALNIVPGNTPGTIEFKFNLDVIDNTGGGGGGGGGGVSYQDVYCIVEQFYDVHLVCIVECVTQCITCIYVPYSEYTDTVCGMQADICGTRADLYCAQQNINCLYDNVSQLWSAIEEIRNRLTNAGF